MTVERERVSTKRGEAALNIGFRQRGRGESAAMVAAIEAEARAAALREVAERLADRAHDTNDECRWCLSDIEDPHADDCAVTISTAILTEATGASE